MSSFLYNMLLNVSQSSVCPVDTVVKGMPENQRALDIFRFLCAGLDGQIA
ncbi:hypothetical protein DFQ00_13112 [Paenibacillus barcinonensis]|uniref:Uncharacterized protein n=1 Tax=Paenibacillus barcinonensis TaxID=198119 RepID=A0A2V4USU5_PAEBA|nr:hypothetical protein DFQ00_13112 [Paenibacillus barcinonensis]